MNVHGLDTPALRRCRYDYGHGAEESSSVDGATNYAKGDFEYLATVEVDVKVKNKHAIT